MRTINIIISEIELNTRLFIKAKKEARRINPDTRFLAHSPESDRLVEILANLEDELEKFKEVDAEELKNDRL